MGTSVKGGLYAKRKGGLNSYSRIDTKTLLTPWIYFDGHYPVVMKLCNLQCLQCKAILNLMFLVLPIWDFVGDVWRPCGPFWLVVWLFLYFVVFFVNHF